MTEKELLATDLKHLPKVLGEVLGMRCTDCLVASMYDDNCEPKTCPQSVPLTPDNAFKWRAWAVEKFGMYLYRCAMFDIARETGEVRLGAAEIYYAEWVLKAKPEDYEKAAALCEYRSWPITWHDSCACNHRGCLSHVSHPCEGCGRTAGRGVVRSKQ